MRSLGIGNFFPAVGYYQHSTSLEVQTGAMTQEPVKTDLTRLLPNPSKLLFLNNTIPELGTSQYNQLNVAVRTQMLRISQQYLLWNYPTFNQTYRY